METQNFLLANHPISATRLKLEQDDFTTAGARALANHPISATRLKLPDAPLLTHSLWLANHPISATRLKHGGNGIGRRVEVVTRQPPNLGNETETSVCCQPLQRGLSLANHPISATRLKLQIPAGIELGPGLANHPISATRLKPASGGFNGGML